MLTKAETYHEVYRSFAWHIPEYYNIGVDICDKHAAIKNRTALIYESDNGRVDTYTFDDFIRLSNQFANCLFAAGITREDRVGILLPQCPETAIAHIAAYKIGGIAIPLFTLFGPDALKYRLANSGAKCLVTDKMSLAKIDQIAHELPQLEKIFIIDGKTRTNAINFWDALSKGSAKFTPVRTRAHDPALIIYTSGTTGPPKGALHAHRTLLGHLPGVEFPHNFFPRKGDVFWTPADWAWIGGLIDVLFPSWHHAMPVVAFRAKKFDPEFAFHLMAKHHIRNTFLPPTALKLLRQVPDATRRRYPSALRSIASAGETLGEELFHWGKSALNVEINEFYGQTEFNLMVCNCADVMAVRPGSMGRAVPGFEVEIVDDSGKVLSPGTQGNIAARRPNPVMFLEYWNNRKATQAKFIGDWCLTGDIGMKDEDDYFWFVGREDDLITSAGYRIGPGEIEDCLIRHRAVAMAAVIGAPDPVRTEIIKAFIVLKDDITADTALEDDIRDFVRHNLAAHEYPREIEFVSDLPMTATGKIIRNALRNQREKDGNDFNKQAVKKN